MTTIDTTTPPPSSRFWDRIAKRYAAKPVADEQTYRTKLRITQDYLRPEMEVLEFGCGTGSTALVHAPFVRHITAIDISPRMIEIARAKAEEAGTAKVTFRCAAIDTLGLAEESVDAVLGLSILHLLRDPDAAIAKVHRALRPDGVFVSSTACLGDTMRWFRPIAVTGRIVGLLPLVRFFGTDDLVAGLTGRGFEIAHLWQPPGKARGVFIVAKKPA